MVSTKIKVLILIAALSTSMIALLLAPIIPVQYIGTEKVDYSAPVKQINLIVNIDASSLTINYAEEPDADLVSFNYSIIIGHGLLYTPPVPLISFINSTTGDVLTITLTIDIPQFSLSSIFFAKSYLTINPHLLCNFSVHTLTGNIALDTSNFLNKTFVALDFTTETGNIDVSLVNMSNILGDLVIYRTTGNCDLVFAKNCNLGGALQVNSTTGNSDVYFSENVTLSEDFIIKTSTGNIYTYLKNILLNDNEIQGIIQTNTGNIHVNSSQWLNPPGNLTLSITTTTGNVRLDIKLEADCISSQLTPDTGTGTISYEGSHLGYHHDGNNLVSNDPLRNSNFNIDLQTGTGNININAERS